MKQATELEEVKDLLQDLWNWISRSAPFQAPEVYNERLIYYEDKVREVIDERS